VIIVNGAHNPGNLCPNRAFTLTQIKHSTPTSSLYHSISKDLKDLMRKAGDVTFADCHKDREGEGVVEFSSYEDMKAALRKFDDTELKGKHIILREAPDNDTERDRRGRRSRSRSRSLRRVSRRSLSRSPRRPPRRSRSRSRSAGPNGKDRGSRSSSPRRALHDESPSPKRSRSRSSDDNREDDK
jgi:arginine/serine-rich splicing factor 4/5/6